MQCHAIVTILTYSIAQVDEQSLMRWTYDLTYDRVRNSRYNITSATAVIVVMMWVFGTAEHGESLTEKVYPLINWTSQTGIRDLPRTKLGLTDPENFFRSPEWGHYGLSICCGLLLIPLHQSNNLFFSGTRRIQWMQHIGSVTLSGLATCGVLLLAYNGIPVEIPWCASL